MEFENMSKEELLSLKESILDTIGNMFISGSELMELPIYSNYMCLDNYLYSTYGI